MKVRRQVIAAGFAAMVVALAGCGSDNEATRVGGAVRSPTADYNVGDIVRLSNLEIVVHGVKDPFDAGITKPAAGSRYVAVDAEVRNRASGPQLVSAYAQFELKDSEDETYIPVSLQGNRIGGQVPPGESVRGDVSFEVPEGRGGFELVFKNLEYGSSATIGLG